MTEGDYEYTMSVVACVANLFTVNESVRCASDSLLSSNDDYHYTVGPFIPVLTCCWGNSFRIFIYTACQYSLLG